MFGQNKKKILRVVLIILALFGITLAWYSYSQRSINNQADYIDTVKPWLRSINQNYKLSDISNVRDKILYLNSNDKSVGDGHIGLFLAFDAWQQYLETNNPELKNQAIKLFDKAANYLPPLHNDIDRLEKILQGNV